MRMNTYTNTCIYIFIYMYIFLCVCMYMYIYTYIYSYKYTCINIYECIRIHIYMIIYICIYCKSNNYQRNGNVVVPGLFIYSGEKQGGKYLEWRSRKKGLIP